MWAIVATAIGGSKFIGSCADDCKAGERLMNSRFHAKVEVLIGQKWEAKLRSRPQKNYDESLEHDVA